MHVIETGVRRQEARQRRGGVALYFVDLALRASTGPIADVSCHARPQESGGDEALRATDTRMREVVQRLEHLTTKSYGYKWTRGASGRIAKNRLASRRESDWLKYELRITTESRQLRVIDLSIGNEIELFNYHSNYNY